MFGINRDSHGNQLYANGNKKPSYVDLTKQFITQAKKAIGLAQRGSFYFIAAIFKRLRPSLQ